MSALGDYLKARRLELGLTQREAAKAVGVSGPYICALETDRNSGTGKQSKPTPGVLEKFAKGYGVDYYKLMALAGYIVPLDPKVLAVLNDPKNRPFIESLGDDPEALSDIIRLVTRYVKR